MKNLLTSLLLLLALAGTAQDVHLTTDTLVTGVWNLGGKNLVFESGGHISGTGTITNGYIQANYFQDIFDTTLTVNILPAFKYFSMRWFGAKPSNVDNYDNIQKAINTCVLNSIADLYAPKGVYNHHGDLLISHIYAGQYVGVTLHFFGDSQFWDATTATTLNCTSPYNWGLGVQLGKGTEIDHLRITGQFAPPVITSDSNYYKLTYAQYHDANSVCNDYYYGIVIDPNVNFNGGQNGSTGVKIHDNMVSNFTICYSISPNGQTRNAEILVFENNRGNECKVVLQTSQAQEKENLVKGLYSWGRCHTLIDIGNSGAYQAGFYNIDGLNVAGKCIRLFNINVSGWYSTIIAHVYAESLGQIGTLTSSGVPILITGCNFHFATAPLVPSRVVLSTNNAAIKFESCTFRYYGAADLLRFVGPATFSNCKYSSTVVRS